MGSRERLRPRRRTLRPIAWHSRELVAPRDGSLHRCRVPLYPGPRRASELRLPLGWYERPLELVVSAIARRQAVIRATRAGR